MVVVFFITLSHNDISQADGWMDSHLGSWVIQHSMPVFCIFILVEGDNKVYCGILQTFASLILKTEPQNIYDGETDFLLS